LQGGSIVDTTLVRGLQVLDYVVNCSGPVRSSIVAKELGLKPSNAHRVLKTLVGTGYLRQDERTKEFVPSLRLWELGTQVISRLDLRSHALPVLQELAHETNETVHLSVLEGGSVIYIEKVDSAQPVSVHTRIGGRAPVHCSATGKAILSELPEVQLLPLLANLQQFTPDTKTDASELRDELELSRRRGFTTSLGEWRIGVHGVAAPIFDGTGKVIASVGTACPAERMMQHNNLEKFGNASRQAAERISRLYGYHPC
jgi:IclR family KDG regulon transcriptional repressor